MTTATKIIVAIASAVAVAAIGFFIYRIVAAESSIYKLFGYFNH